MGTKDPERSIRKKRVKKVGKKVGEKKLHEQWNGQLNGKRLKGFTKLNLGKKMLGKKIRTECHKTFNP
jgi:hypothetical protein